MVTMLGFGKTPKDIFAVNKAALSPEEIKFFQLLATIAQDHISARPETTNEELIANCYSRFKSPTAAYMLMLKKDLPGMDPDVIPAMQLVGNICTGYDSDRLLKEEALANHLGRRFDAHAALEQFIEKSHIGEEAKKLARRYLSEHWHEITHNRQVWDRIQKDQALEQWATGSLTQQKPLFDSEAELQVFGKQLSAQFQDLFLVRKAFQTAGLPTQIAARFMGRVLTHDEPIWKKEAERIAQKAAREAEKREHFLSELREDQKRKLQREAEEARKRAEAKIAEGELVKKTPLPYALEGPQATDKEAANRFGLLTHLAGSTAHEASHAKALVQVCHGASALLNTRFKGIKELGQLVLSPANLVAAAQLYTADNPFPGAHPPTDAEISVTATKLHNSFLTSSASRFAIERLMQNDDQIVLLALLTCPMQRCRDYLSSLQRVRGQMASERKAVSDLEEGLAAFSPEERALFTEDQQALEAARKALAAKRSELGVDQLRLELTEEIRHTLAGENLLRNGAAKATTPAAPAASNGSAILSSPQADVLHDFPELQAGPSAQGEKFAAIYRRATPDIRVDIRRNAAPDILAAELRQFLGRTQQGLLKDELLAFMDDRHGFEINTRAGQQFLEHEAYGISVPLAPSEHLTADLFAAKMQFEERQFQQLAMLETLQEAGVKLEGVEPDLTAKGVITLRHPSISGKMMRVAEHGYMSPDDFTALQGLINQLQPDREVPLPKLVGSADAEKGEHPWKLPAGHRLMIFDTGPLLKLSAPRAAAPAYPEEAGAKQEETARTWLDLVEHTAALPNVTVVVPAVIANLELQGKVPVSDAEHHRRQLQVVDPRFRKGSGYYHELSAAAVAKMLKTASHARIIEGPEGKQVLIEKGANPKIVVMETEGDKIVYRKARKVLKLPEPERVAALQAEVYGRSQGDFAIDRILKELPLLVPAAVVSDDSSYLYNSRPRTTGQGLSVAGTGTGRYLDAEIRVRGRALQKIMDETQPMSVFRIGNEINAYWMPKQQKGYMYFTNYSQAGATTAPGGPPPETVHDIIKEGWRVHKAAPVGGPQKPAWSEGKRLGPVGRSLIAPAHVNERAGERVKGS